MRLRLTIRAKLSLALLLVTLLTVGVSGALTLRRFTTYVHQQAERELENIQHAIRLILELRQDDALAIAQSFALRDDVQQGTLTGDRDALMRIVRRIMQERKLYYVVVTDAEGTVLARGHAPGVFGDTVSDLTAFSWPLRGLTIATIARMPTQPLVAAGGAPIHERAPPYRLLGAVLAGYALDGAFLSDLKATVGEEVSLIVDGVRLYTTLPVTDTLQPIPVGIETSPVELRIADETYRAIYIPLKGRDDDDPVGTLEVAQSEASVEAILSQIAKTVTVSAVGVSLVVIALALWLASRLTQPLARLTRAVRAFGRAGYSPPIVIRSGDEFETLGNAFNRMVAERECTEAALQRSEANYRSLVKNAMYGIYRSSPEGKFQTVNPALVRMLGYESEEELLGADLPEDVCAGSGQLEKYRDADRIEGVEVEWKRKDGTPITVRLSGRPVRSKGGEVESFEMIAEDVTERQKFEAQLRQTQKMQALGQLVAGIAHDFNNLLTVVRSNAELLAMDLRLGPSEHRLSIAHIEAAAASGATLIRQLMGFTRQADLAPQPLDFNAAVRNTVAMLRHVIPETVKIEATYDTDIGSVPVDPVALQQILLNLGTNAWDAMPDGGVLRIAASAMTFTEADRESHPWVVPGAYACILVSDTGIGMDRVTQAQVFEPFFTTKPTGRGTGMGLAMVYGLVKQHGGFVHLYSEPGRGTQFKLFFPLQPVLEPVAALRIPTVRMPAGPLQTGTETILLVEDQEVLRVTTRRALEKLGYTVIARCDGEEALQELDAATEQFDIILSDIVMPRLGGPELVEAVRRTGRSPGFVLMSGYASAELEGRGVLGGGVVFLQKPWTLAELASAVRTALGDVPPVPAEGGE